MRKRAERQMHSNPSFRLVQSFQAWYEQLGLEDAESGAPETGVGRGALQGHGKGKLQVRGMWGPGTSIWKPHVLDCLGAL